MAEKPERFETQASTYWDRFYKRNADKFFKDRHYLDKEFPEVAVGKKVILEVGCGAGNTVYPLVELNPELHVYACDFSPTAVDLVKGHPLHATGRVKAFTADITQNSLRDSVPENSVDICTVIFVLSAICPANMPKAIANIRATLKPGSGRLLFRDYAEGDLAQSRLHDSRGRLLGANFYVRGDGTCCYYFTEEEVKALFATQGFVCEGVRLHERDIENRKTGVVMHRRWLQCIFRLSANGSVAVPAQLPATAVAEADATGARPVSAAGSGNGVQPMDEGDDDQDDTRQLEEDAPEAHLEGGPGRRLHELQVPGCCWECELEGARIPPWAEPLAKFIATQPELFQMKAVLQLGAGACPFPCLAALRAARRVVAADACLVALQCLAGNLARNGSTVVIERVRCRQVASSSETDIQQLLKEQPGGFDVVVYGGDMQEPEWSAKDAFGAAAAVLSLSPAAWLLLCHSGTGEDSTVDAAEAARFCLTSLGSQGLCAWTSEVDAAGACCSFSVWRRVQQ